MIPQSRNMTKEDIPRLVFLEKRLFPHPWNAGDFEGEFLSPERFCRVFEESGEILAYLCARQVPDGFEIFKIACHPDFQRKGFAGLLLEEIVTLSKKAVYSDLFLEVAANNDQAIAFYSKHGFTMCGRRKAYYPGGIDALNLVKKGLSIKEML